MGVRGLQTYLEQYCPEACYRVDIARLAQEYKNRTGEDAKIVVDAQSCYSPWYKGLDWRAGLELQELINRLRAFVDGFKKLGIQLIFFFGGLTPEKKRDAWIVRRRKNLDDIQILFDVYKYDNSTDLLREYDSVPPNMGITTSYILKYVLKCQVYMSVEECDEEVISYAHKHKCFAIFGQDTDFVVSELNGAIILSSKNFNVRTMTTLRYNSEKLAQNLGISVAQLPLFALLAGNDFVPFDSIKNFHRRMCDADDGRRTSLPFDVLLPAIGRYINTLPKNVPIEETLERIAIDLFGDTSRIEVLRMSHAAYFVRDTQTVEALPEDTWGRILRVARYRHKNVLVPNIVYSIMNDLTFETSTAFEDLLAVNNNNPCVRDQPSSTVTRPLRARLYGVLLHEKPPPKTVREYCGDNSESYLAPFVVEPVEPIVQHPGLITLWSENRSDYLNEIRWKLFLTSVHPTLTQTRVQSFDDDLFAMLSAYYLYKIQYLNVGELDAVLATIATFRLYRQFRANAVQYKLNARAAHISVTFIRTYGMILTLLGACGYPVELSAANVVPRFEGKLFQKKFAEVMKDPLKYRRNDLCEKDYACMDSYYRMRRFIIPEMRKKRDDQKMNRAQKFA